MAGYGRVADRWRNAAWLAILVVSLSACSTAGLQDRGSYLVDGSHRAVSRSSRVKHLIMHYTVGSFESSLAELSEGAVSAHYLVPRQAIVVGSKQVVLQLVPEEQSAWHAGVSYWQGRTNINDSSIGIEIVNEGPSGQSWQAFTTAQIDVVKKMALDIILRHGIKPYRVLGHSDIAPSRKTDPGPLFPWKELAAAGVGAWPDSATVSRYLGGRDPQATVGNIALLQAQLRQYGYDAPLTGQLDPATVQVLIAFQMHFRPADHSGAADAETQAILRALLEKYRVQEE